MTTQDWIFRSLAVLLAILACGAIVFGLWGDRLRGRTKRCRCPKCWYDLDGAVPESDGRVLCSECGTRSTERILHRSRRRWWVVFPALCTLLVGAVSWSMPAIKRHGWRSAVPTWAIVHFWSLDEVAWMENGASTPMLAELDRRIAENIVSNDMLEAWSIRVAGAYGREADSSGSVARSFYPGSTCAVLDFGPILRVAHPESFATGFHIGLGGDVESQIHTQTQNSPIRPSGLSGPQRNLADESDLLRSVLCGVVASDQWVDNGGSEAILRRLGTRFLVRAPPETTKRCRTVLAALERAVRAIGATPVSTSIRIDDVDGMDATMYNVGDIPSHRAGIDMWAEECVESVWVRLYNNVESDSWTDNGGSQGTAFKYPPFLIVRTTPEIQAKVAQYIEQLRASQTP